MQKDETVQQNRAVKTQVLRQIIDYSYLSADVVTGITATNVLLPNSNFLITSNCVYNAIAKLSTEIVAKLNGN